MAILLPGGAGYIGSHTAVELLKKGKEIEYEEIPHIRMRAYESSAKKSAVNILKRSFVSENMLKEKLAQKGHKKRFINYAIKYCRDYDLIDDKRFTKIAVNSLKLKGKSKRFIIDYLKKSKIKNSLIERASNSISYRSENKALKTIKTSFSITNKHIHKFTIIPSIKSLCQ